MPTDDEDEDLLTCQQCFQDYVLRDDQTDDGFCSDSCMKQYDAELYDDDPDDEEE